jgi:glc operon protein GlcG
MECLSLELAGKLLAAVIARVGDAYSTPVCVSACDASGFLLAFSRIDGAPECSIQLAQQ